MNNTGEMSIMPTLNKNKKIQKYFIDKKTLLNYQNKALFCISILSTISCIHYNYTKSSAMITMCLHIISLYCFIDIFYITETTSKLHHMFSIAIMIYVYVKNVQSYDYVSVGYIFCKTEISSIFLVFRYWLDRKTVIYKINLAVFYLLFLKIRVIDFYSVISPDSHIYIITEKYSKDNFTLTFIFLGSMYGFYTLYIYWFIQINILLYRTLYTKRDVLV
uniref:TLC domain-containing protein n=1 Tax=viral metagenome TaxID=1070528 RepID=A0A6C0K227_9ZZZZ